MPELEWGDASAGLRFGLRLPASEVTAGGTIVLELVCENLTSEPAWVFGFQANYPRSLRVSPPKADRPYIRVSFADVNVLHPPSALTRIEPRGRLSTWLDLSFAFDRRGAGAWEIAFVYEAVKLAAKAAAYRPDPTREARTPVVTLVVTRAISLREAGIDEALENELDHHLLAGDPDTATRLRALGSGGAMYAARRFARVLLPTADARLGWRALDVLELLGEQGIEAVASATLELPHARHALTFAEEWLRFRRGAPTDPKDLPFRHALEEMREQPDRRGNLVITWAPYDSAIHGSLRMEIFGNRDRILVHRKPGHDVPTTRRTQMSRESARGLLDAIAWSGVWMMRPLRAEGMPDEPRPTLEIQLALGDTFTRRLAMWNGEWRHGPLSHLTDLLERLALDVTGESSPPPM